MPQVCGASRTFRCCLQRVGHESHGCGCHGPRWSRSFYAGNYGPWFGEHRSAGIDKLREKRLEFHAWVTKTSWSQMDAKNIKEHHGNIYTAKVNGIIPWPGIQRPSRWVAGDPNPGSAFTAREDGSYEMRRAYWFYKQ